MAMAMAMHLLDSPKDIRYGSHSNQDNHQLWSDGMGRICNLLLMGPGIWDLEVWCVTSEMSQREHAPLFSSFSANDSYQRQAAAYCGYLYSAECSCSIHFALVHWFDSGRLHPPHRSLRSTPPTKSIPGDDR